jgi:PhzF family phenazine biosynthesis protein
MTRREAGTRVTVSVHIVNAFTVNGTGGNPAGVVLDADALDETAMQSIATRTGLSETAFVSRSPSAGARLDFFTPTRRIAHCGHATIAAFALMRAQGLIVDGDTSKLTVDGRRRILLRDGAVFMEQLAPRYTQLSDDSRSGATHDEILAAMGLTAEQLDLRSTPRIVDTGNRFLLLGVASEADLAAIVPEQKALAQISEELDLIGFHVFAVTSGSGSVQATTRMFAPRYGIPEESATGMAAGPLACLLHDVIGDRRTRFVIEQGRYMAPPSISRILVDLRIEEGRIAGLMAGGEGHAVRTVRVELEVPRMREPG